MEGRSKIPGFLIIVTEETSICFSERIHSECVRDVQSRAHCPWKVSERSVMSCCSKLNYWSAKYTIPRGYSMLCLSLHSPKNPSKYHKIIVNKFLIIPIALSISIKRYQIMVITATEWANSSVVVDEILDLMYSIFMIIGISGVFLSNCY